MPTTWIQTETGTMRVATPETTAFDRVRYPAAAGHLSNIATVLAELTEWLKTRRPRAIPLRPGEPSGGTVNERWQVKPNAELEIDL